MKILSFDEVNQLWIEEGYKISKSIGDMRRKDIEESLKNKKTISPEIPIEEVD